MAILTSADYPAIRAAIDVNLTDQQLPNTTIGLTIYQDAADADVLELHPTAEDETGNNATRVTRAAIFFCAARLIPAVVRLTSVTTQSRDLSYARLLYDPDKFIDKLKNMAVAEINEVLTPSAETPERPTMFKRGPARRAPNLPRSTT